MNKIINPAEVPQYLLDALKRTYPELWATKDPATLYQYGHILKELVDLEVMQAAVLVAGAYTCPIANFCKCHPIQFRHVQEIDPLINLDLHEFLNRYPYTVGTYDFVIAALTLEHTGNRLEFIDGVLEALKPGGVAILTSALADTHNTAVLNTIADWVEGKAGWIGEPDWQGEGIASIVFRRVT